MFLCGYNEDDLLILRLIMLWLMIYLSQILNLALGFFVLMIFGLFSLSEASLFSPANFELAISASYVYICISIRCDGGACFLQLFMTKVWNFDLVFYDLPILLGVGRIYTFLLSLFVCDMFCKLKKILKNHKKFNLGM